VAPRRAAGFAAAFAAAALVASAQPALAARPAALGDGPSAAVAQVVGTKGNGSVTGTVTVRDAVNKRGRAFIKVQVSLKGLKPGAHGLNIHELGDVTCDDGSCTGASFNPDGLPHGKPDGVKKFGASASHYVGEGSRYWRHVGDIGNVTADASGAVDIAFEEPVIALSGPNSVVGRSVVVHADADDYVNEPAAIIAFGTLKAQ
jgi:Cu-Zn family superoxide dismutase